MVVDVEVGDGFVQQQLSKQIQVQKSTSRVKTISKQAQLVLAEDPRFTTRRSNFYKALLPYKKVTAVGWELMEWGRTVEEVKVEKHDFLKFILHTDRLPTDVIDEALIQIIAPVITEGNEKWKGFYNDETISFSMRDEAFKDMVKRRAVSFQAGNAIRCRLEIERKLDESGEPVITGYSVPIVIEKIDVSGAIETPQGKRQRLVDKQVKGQRKLFDPPAEA